MSLSSRSWFRGLAGASAAVIFTVAGGAAALADNLDADGDALTAESQTTMAFGAVQCGVASGKNALVTVTRQGSATGTNTFASSAAVDVTVTSSSGAVTASVPSGAAGDVDLTSTWTAASNGAVSEAVTVPVSVLSSTPGAGTATLTFTGRGPNTDGALITRTDSVSVTWTTGSCSTPTTTTVTCPPSAQTYTGAAVEPCSATVTGTGLSQPATVTYSNNIDVGTATASASFAGDATHQASSGSATFEIAKAASTTTVTCPANVSWTGSAQAPCTAVVTGAGGLDQSLTVSYADNTGVGTATASAGYGGDANHTASSMSETFTIAKAGSAVTVSCGPGPFTYDGSAQEPCTATATGAGGLSQPLAVTYSDNTDAGTATASASFAGDATHEGASGSAMFAIGQASADCQVTGFSGPYDGATHGLTATCTGVDGADLSAGFDPGDSFTVAGDHTAHWTFEGGTNYGDQTGTGSVDISKADSTTLVTCPATVTYDGTAQEPCTAQVTGAGELNQALTVDYAGNTNAGTSTASASFAGDDNHLASNDSTSFEIEKAVSETTVTCPDGPFVYTGGPITPACTASATGVGGLDESATVTFSDNTDAGQATASASFAGDANHNGSTGSTTFTIDKAPSTVTLLCTSPVTYTGQPLEVCSATATGAGIGTPVALTVDYTDNTDAGTAGASATWAGDANHEGSSDDTTFTILQAPSVTTVSCPVGPYAYTGLAQMPCTASVTGAGGLDESLTVTYADNVHAGTATASASYAGDDNHLASADSGTFTIGEAETVTTVTCPASVNFTGSAITPCTALVTGPPASASR